jgi:hypothetical protein
MPGRRPCIPQRPDDDVPVDALDVQLGSIVARVEREQDFAPAVAGRRRVSTGWGRFNREMPIC